MFCKTNSISDKKYISAVLLLYFWQAKKGVL